MSTHKSFLNHLFSNRKKIGVILASLLLIVMFQNCGNAGSTGAKAGSTVLASEVPPVTTVPPGTVVPNSCAVAVPCTVGVACTTTTGIPTAVNQAWVMGAANCGFNCIAGYTGATCATPPVGGPVPPTLAEQRAACNTALTTPTLNSVSLPGTATAASSAVIRSGLGSTNSGNSGSVNFDFAVDRGISNATVFNLAANNCNSHVSTTLRCTVVANNPANPTDAPLSVTNAFDTAGDSLLTATAVPMTIAAGAYSNNDCETQLGLGVTTGAFRISPNTNTERCVQADMWLRLEAQTAVAGINGSNRNSAPRYFKVTINNGCWVESRLKDSAGDLGRVINFGTAVAIDGNWAAVVAPTDDASATVLDVGAVYMYMYDGSNWVQKGNKILISGAAAMDTIASVAIRGDSMVIGSPYNSGSGAVYFYRRSGETWTRVDSEAAPNAAANQAFGQTVAINDRYVFVGSPNYTGALAKNGGVAIYSHSATGMTYIKTVFGASANMAFGSSIAVDNTILAIGAPQALGREGSAPGSVFVFDEAGGAFNLVSTKTGSINAEKFGASVAVNGNRLAVGSPNYIVGGVSGFGRASYYDTYSAAAPTRTIQGGASTENLGQSVALSSTGLYVGVPFANNRAGRVDHYLYSNINNLYYRNLAYNEGANSAYGFAVAVSGEFVVIGARIKNDPNDNSGAAYIYRYK